MAFCPTTAHTATPLTSSRKRLNNCIHPQLLCNSKPSSNKHRTHSAALQVQALASAVPFPLNVDYLATEFAGHGVSFEGIGGSCAVKMALDNGSVAHLLLPSGLITSYKPAMWHGATLQVLHTTVTEGEGGEAVIRGGVSTDFHCRSDDGLLSWSPGAWALHDVRGSSAESIQIPGEETDINLEFFQLFCSTRQIITSLYEKKAIRPRSFTFSLTTGAVEFVSIAPENKVEVKCLVVLHPELLASEFTITNTSSSSLQLSSSVINHLRVSTPDATYAIGLQGSNYRSRAPMASEFTIVPPDFNEESSRASQQWADKGLEMVLSGWKSSTAEDSEGEEDDNYAHMTAKMCRIYSHAPREFTVVDRGRRNSLSVHRRGFNELYLLSPGSNYEWYGKYAYVCVGPAMLHPVVLGPGGIWEGAQYLRNPNL